MSSEQPPKFEQKKEITQREVDFIFKLAEALNISDEEAATGIAKQLQELKSARGFPDLVDIIDPDGFSAEVKRLDEQAKRRLSLAFEKFEESIKPQQKEAGEPTKRSTREKSLPGTAFEEKPKETTEDEPEKTEPNIKIGGAFKK